MYLKSIFIMSLMSLLSFGHEPPATTGNINVEVNNINTAKGDIIIMVYASQKDHLSRGGTAKLPVSNTGTMEFPLEDLTFGTYSIMIFQDVNGNGKLDKNFFNIPTEPYGFSNNVRPRFRAPTFEESKFDFTQDGQPLSIDIKKVFG